jgi:hypothetical protein
MILFGCGVAVGAIAVGALVEWLHIPVGGFWFRDGL